MIALNGAFPHRPTGLIATTKNVGPLKHVHAMTNNNQSKGIMKNVFRGYPVCVLLAVCVAGPVWAGTLTDITWVSNGGQYINDTIVNGNTSPLAFTATTDLAQPFLNAADSTVTLDYGNYYAISFLGYGEMIGLGTVSFLLDGGTTETQDVVFPDPSVASGRFASFVLPNGDMVTISATGLAADRIQIVADGGGLSPDGHNPDAFYLFRYIRAADVVPMLNIVPAAPGFAAISWTPAVPGFRLQDNRSLSPATWTNSVSNATNPVVVPVNQTNHFFRLIKP
jgi:hypothetical protein